MDIKLKTYIVAFIDLLGFSSMVKHDCENPDGKQRYIKSLYSIYLKTKSLKETINGLQLIQFSDSIVLAIPYSHDNYIEIIKVISSYQFDLLNSGILCRGGVSYGKHFSSEDFLFSNGMIDAYRLESTVALTPRIIVSKELIELIHPSSSHYPEFLLLKERDGLWFIKYLNGKTHKENWDVICKAIDDKLSDIPAIRSKQIWLIDYYNHQFPKYQKNNIQRFG